MRRNRNIFVNKAGVLVFASLPRALPAGRTDLPVSAADSHSGGVA